MFRTNDTEQFLHLTKEDGSERSLSEIESGEASNATDMVQRDGDSNWPYPAAIPAVATALEAGPQQATAKPTNRLRAMLQRVYQRLTENDWERERREREEYLADSADLYDLEARMRRYDRFAAGPWERGL